MKTLIAIVVLLVLSFSCGQTQVNQTGKQNIMHKYTNELIHESSPYLLQHAHNPVNWYPWDDRALKKAKDENQKQIQIENMIITLNEKDD